MIKKCILGISVLLSAFRADSQNIVFSPQVFASQGQHFQNAQFELSWTIGEMSAVSTISSGNSTFTQGFQQPDKFSIAFTEDLMASWSAGLYPNPADEYVTLSLNAMNNEEMVVEILDAAGKLVRNPKKLQVLPGQQQIDFPLTDMASGIYLLRLSTVDGRYQRSYRFNKSNS
jgi:hypothetical protein